MVDGGPPLLQRASYVPAQSVVPEGKVKIILDETLMAFETINCHTLSNDQTTSIAAKDMLRFMEATGHEPLVLKVTA
jgi:Ala-tRNA(Pro) deacylase